MDKVRLVYSGKAKDVYATEDPQLYIMHYRNDLTALNGGKKGSFSGKGALNREISDKIFKYLETRGIHTHLVRSLGPDDTLVKKVRIFPLEVIVRNIAAGSFTKKYGVKEGTPLKCPVLEYSLKNDELGDPMLSASHAIALDLATEAQIDQIGATALEVNTALQELFDKINLTLVDFKIEFGITDDDQILLADEITPDTCRLWEKGTGAHMDKDRFRRDLGGVEEAYRAVAQRLA